MPIQGTTAYGSPSAKPMSANMNNNNNSDAPQMKAALDRVFTYLDAGHIWHMNAGAECRLNHVRGWGRWHEAEAKCDAKKRLCLTKLVSDIPTLRYVANTDPGPLTAAHAYVFPAYTDHNGFSALFKQHHDLWIAREKEFIEAIKIACELSNKFDTKLYKELLCLKAEVENEVFRVESMRGRLSLAGWMGHDIGVVSMILHEYFECKYDGGEIDFNVG